MLPKWTFYVVIIIIFLIFIFFSFQVNDFITTELNESL